MNPPIITLTTDFGDRDGFVGAMKGVILSILPEARIVDIAHHVPRQDVAAGTRVLQTACLHFPPGTIHLAVIDPGVGSERKPLAVQTDHHTFILPDNGLITRVDQFDHVQQARAIENPDFMLSAVTQTFHGRDIFAPTAAHLAAGKAFEDVGPQLDQLVRLRRSAPRVEGNTIHGQITYVDTFGNLFTDIESKVMSQIGGDGVLTIGETRIQNLSHAYADVPAGRLLYVMGSSGAIEVAVNQGSAAQRLGLGVGATVTIQGRKGG